MTATVPISESNIKYNVIFPQRILYYDSQDDLESDRWYASTMEIHLKSLRDVEELLDTLDSPMFYQLEVTDVGDKISELYVAEEYADKTVDEIYDLYFEKEPIKIIKKKE